MSENSTPGYAVECPENCSTRLRARSLETRLREALEKLRVAKEQVNELNEVLRQAGWGQGEIDSAAEMLFKKDDRIAELERGVREWISVSERLPENGGVLAITANKEIDIYQWNLISDYANDPDPQARITHWMPLPARPDADRLQKEE